MNEIVPLAPLSLIHNRFNRVFPKRGGSNKLPDVGLGFGGCMLGRAMAPATVYKHHSLIFQLTLRITPHNALILTSALSRS